MKAENNIGGLLGKSSRLLSNNFNSDLKALGITVEQWILLAVLWEKNNLSQKELQEALLKDKASVNSLVSYLIKSGFITKKKSTEDKRSFIVSLTTKGEEIKMQTIPLAMKNISLAIHNIDKNELATFVKVCTQIIRNLTEEKKDEK